MRLDGRRESNNVEDRRGMSTGAKAGIGGIGGIIMIALFTLLSGGNLGDVIGNVVQQGALGSVQEEQVEGQRQFTAEEEELFRERADASSNPCPTCSRESRDVSVRTCSERESTSRDVP